jgi:hypothetical protein
MVKVHAHLFLSDDSRSAQAINATLTRGKSESVGDPNRVLGPKPFPVSPFVPGDTSLKAPSLRQWMGGRVV